ncbi:hypothetical protein [Photobacterium damselae]|uniref:hypothetical protein n=1 Tax=Photobacterium damselae TaxID=38293 RepID=UPI000A2FEE03|nr:hypothetical protein [Photobacterium damselae]ARR51805.1 hypothetical protein CAY62_20530 [Photobacterium damselae subsp. damselae]
MKNLKVKLLHILQKMNLLPDDIISAKDLERGRGLEKQLDEYREMIERIEEQTGYFSSKQGHFSISHASEIDNYLSHLYELRFGKKPTSSTAITYLRPKPLFIQLGN